MSPPLLVRSHHIRPRPPHALPPPPFSSLSNPVRKRSKKRSRRLSRIVVEKTRRRYHIRSTTDLLSHLSQFLEVQAERSSSPDSFVPSSPNRSPFLPPPFSPPCLPTFFLTPPTSSFSHSRLSTPTLLLPPSTPSLFYQPWDKLSYPPPSLSSSPSFSSTPTVTSVSTAPHTKDAPTPFNPQHLYSPPTTVVDSESMVAFEYSDKFMVPLPRRVHSPLPTPPRDGDSDTIVVNPTIGILAASSDHMEENSPGTAMAPEREPNWRSTIVSRTDVSPI